MQQNDYPRLKALVGRLCETLGKPITDELIESFWKALRNCEFADLEARVDDYIAKAGENTRFPRPSQLRPVNVGTPDTEDSAETQRGYWRSMIVDVIARAMWTDMRGLEPIIIENRESLGAWMLALLNDVCGKDADKQRSFNLQAYCESRALQIAARFQDAEFEKRPEYLGWTGDNWDIAANKHLFALILKGRKYTKKATAALVRWKNKWAQAMREEATKDGVEAGYQREVWDSYMKMAEQEFA